MAEDARAVMVLNAGTPLEVQQTVKEIESLLAGSPSGNVSFVRVVDTEGKAHLINTHEIVEFHEPPENASASFT